MSVNSQQSRGKVFGSADQSGAHQGHPLLKVVTAAFRRFAGNLLRRPGGLDSSNAISAETPSPVGFHAFISYTRDPDQPIARALREGLQRFGRTAFARRLLRVFLDEAILDAGGELPGRISEAIRQSSYLIVLASPQSRTRRWVNSEISEFLGTHGPDRILICLTAGEIAWDADRNVFDSQTNAVPEALAETFEREPFWLDLRWARTASDLTLTNPRWLDVIARLSARLRALPLDEVIGADLLERKRFARYRFLAVGVIVALAVAAIGLGTFLYFQWLIAERQGQEAQFRAEIGAAEALLATSPTEALKQAAASVARAIGERVDLPDLQGGLITAIDGSREMRRLKGPMGYATTYGDIRDLAISPDETRIAVVSSDMAYLLDLRGSLVAAPIAGKAGDHIYANSVAWSPDGGYLVIASGDVGADGLRGAALYLLSAQGSVINTMLDTSDAPFLSAVFLGNDVIFAGDAKGRLWRIALGGSGTAAVINQIDGPINRVITVPANGGDQPAIIAISGRTANTLVTHFDQRDVILKPPESQPIAGGSLSIIEAKTPRGQRSIAISKSPPGLVVVGSEDGEVAFWDYSDRKRGLRRTVAFTAHAGAVTSLAVSKDGAFVATGGDDGLIRLWNEKGEAMSRPLMGHGNAVGGLAFIEDDTTLISGGREGTLRLWDTHDITARRTFPQYQAIHMSSPCGLVSATTDDRFGLFDLLAKPIGNPISAPSGGKFVTTAISPTCDRIAVVNTDNADRSTIQILDKSGAEFGRIEAGSDRIDHLAFAGDGTRLAVALSRKSADSKRLFEFRLRIYDAASGRIVTETADAGGVSAIAVNARGVEPQFATISTIYAPAVAHSVRLWTQDGAAAGEIRADAAQSPEYSAIAFHPLGRSIAIGVAFQPNSLDAKLDRFEVRLVDLEKRTVSARLRGHTARVSAIAFSQTGELVATAGSSGFPEKDYSVRLWTRRGMPLGHPFLGHLFGVRDLGFSGDASKLISLDDSGEVREWIVGTKELVTIARARSRAPDLNAEGERFLQDGRRFANVKDWQSAENAYTAALDLRPDDDGALTARGNLRLQRRALAEAISDYDRAIELAPYNEIHYYNRGKARLNTEDWPGAEVDFSRALDLFYTMLRPTILIAEFVPMVRESIRSSQIAHQFARAELLGLRGMARAKLGHFQAAIADFSEAIQTGPPDANILSWRTRLFEITGQWEAAFADASRIIEIQSNNGFAYASRARVGLRLGHSKDTVAADCTRAREAGQGESDLPAPCRSTN
jgi:WD40 repeat protein